MAKLNFKNIAASVTKRALPAAAGGALGLAANKVIPASINPKIRSLIKIGVGAILPELSPKNEMLRFAGAGMVGQAGAELAGELIPAIAGVDGIGDTDYVVDEDFVTGPDDEYDQDDDMSGIDEDPMHGVDDIEL